MRMPRRRSAHSVRHGPRRPTASAIQSEREIGRSGDPVGYRAYPQMSYNVWAGSVDNPVGRPAPGWHREARMPATPADALRQAHLSDQGDRRGVLPPDHLHRLPDLLLGAAARPDLGQGGSRARWRTRSSRPGPQGHGVGPRLDHRARQLHLRHQWRDPHARRISSSVIGPGPPSTSSRSATSASRSATTTRSLTRSPTATCPTTWPAASSRRSTTTWSSTASCCRPRCRPRTRASSSRTRCRPT